MSYAIAMNKAWEEVLKLSADKEISVKFLADEYTVNTQDRSIISLSCNVPAKDFMSILILHYLAHKLQALPKLTGEWLSFKELSGVEGYLAAFKKRAIDPIIRKHGANPEGILGFLDKFPAKKVNQGDVGVVIDAFEGVPVLITLWRGDDEFGPDANMLFDRSITKIFCTEDIVVLAGTIAGEL